MSGRRKKTVQTRLRGAKRGTKEPIDSVCLPPDGKSEGILGRRVHKNKVDQVLKSSDCGPVTVRDECNSFSSQSLLIPKLPENAICGMVTSAIKQLRSGLEVLSHLQPEGSMHFKSKCLTISCHTDASQASIDLDVTDCIDIEEYREPKQDSLKSILRPGIFNVSKEVSNEQPAHDNVSAGLMLHMSLDKVFRAMSIATVNDVVLLYITKQSLQKNCIVLEIHHAKGIYIHSHDIRVLPKESTTDLKIAKMNASRKKFKVSVQMSTTDFLKTLRCGNKNGNTVQIFTKYDTEKRNNYCYIAIKGERLGSDMHSRFFFSVENGTPLNCYNNNLYDMKKLLIIAKATNMSNIIHIYMNATEDVLGVKYRVGTIGVFRCMIAPLVAKSSSTFECQDKEKTDSGVPECNRSNLAELPAMDLSF